MKFRICKDSTIESQESQFFNYLVDTMSMSEIPVVLGVFALQIPEQRLQRIVTAASV